MNNKRTPADYCAQTLLLYYRAQEIELMLVTFPAAENFVSINSVHKWKTTFKSLFWIHIRAFKSIEEKGL